MYRHRSPRVNYRKVVGLGVFYLETRSSLEAVMAEPR